MTESHNHADIFKPATQSRVFEDVIDQIQEAILTGRLKPGDKLPAERNLKEMLNVSRGTLREALRVLELKGLVSVKTGVNGGAVVNSVSTHPFSESLALLIRHQKVCLADLSEFRRGVEGTVGALAAERADENDCARLKSLLGEAEELLAKGISEWVAFIDTDNRLHMEIAHIADNPVYESVLKTLHENISKYYERLLPRTAENLEYNFNDLRSITEAVCSGDSELAKKLCMDHVTHFSRLMEEQEE